MQNTVHNSPIYKLPKQQEVKLQLCYFKFQTQRTQNKYIGTP